MSDSTMVSSLKKSLSGFFGSAAQAVEGGLSRVGTEILPNWVNSQLDLQSDDQLKRTTFNQQAAPRRMQGDTVQGPGVQSPSGFNRFLSNSVVDFGGIHMTGGHLLVFGAMAIGTVFVLKKVL